MGLLRILSLNCHGFNVGVEQYLKGVISEVDVILLQETWLSDRNCNAIDRISDEFISFHSSAMEVKLSSGVLSGRPFGGTAILIRKYIAPYCSRVITDNPRITAIHCCIDKSNTDLVISSLYMPWSDRSADQLIEYESTVGCLQGIIDRHIGCSFIFAGDLNVSKDRSNASSTLMHNFCIRNNIMWLNPVADGIDYSFHNDVNCHYSLIDHFLCSSCCAKSDTLILVDGDNPSDHLAIYSEFECGNMSNDMESQTCNSWKLNWDKADTSLYETTLTNLLSKITLPVDALTCSCSDCADHANALELYYNDIIGCMRRAGKSCVPRIKVGVQKHWWSPELDDLKQQCIDATDMWKSAGKPRSGDINSNRVRCKMRYKTAIKDACINADSEFNDNLYDHLCTKDVDGFWKTWSKKFCQNSLKPTCILNGQSGDDNIRKEFTEYYKSVFSPNTAGADDCFKSEVDELLSDARSAGNNALPPAIDISTLQQCIGILKPHKAAGPDDICNEHIIYGGAQLSVHLCLLFNAMLRHSFIPTAFHYGVIIPLLKNKHGDASKLDMYRGITLSVVVSKLFEQVLLSLFGDSLTSDSLQFGFKKNSSCSHALFTLGETVKYFTKRGSKIHCVSLDASKAFDKVLHNGLFLKMLRKGISTSFIQILMKWYGSLICSVSWNCVFSEPFAVKCGVRQGGVLSPYLFALYVDELIGTLRHSGFGAYITNIFAGCIFYADDIMLVSCSCYGLQQLVQLCEIYGKQWDICFNPSKCQGISFGGRSPKSMMCMLNSLPIQWVNKMKYLGVYYKTDSCEIDISAAVGKFYGNFNNILSVLGHKRDEMSAVHLIKCYCLPTLTYACETWSVFDKHKLSVVWNNCFRKIFNCCWRESVSSLLYFCNVMPMSYLIDERRLIFLNKMLNSDVQLLSLLAKIAHNEFIATGDKYNVTLFMSKSNIQSHVWQTFANSTKL